jgi:hypothetical protein
MWESFVLIHNLGNLPTNELDENVLIKSQDPTTLFVHLVQIGKGYEISLKFFFWSVFICSFFDGFRFRFGFRFCFCFDLDLDFGIGIDFGFGFGFFYFAF